MEVITKGTYAAEITKTSDGNYMVFWLYNYDANKRAFTRPDIWDRKTYKTHAMAVKKSQQWLNTQA